MRAVRAGRAMALDGGAHFSRPGPRLVDGVESLVPVLHPELVASPAGARAKTRPVRTFLLLSTLSPQGLQTLATTPERPLEVNREIEAIGGRVVRQWFLLGVYDVLSVVEAPDERTISRLSVELASRGSATFETLPAIPVEELIAALDPGDAHP